MLIFRMHFKLSRNQTQHGHTSVDSPNFAVQLFYKNLSERPLPIMVR